MENDQKPRTLNVSYEAACQGRQVECRISYLVTPDEEPELLKRAHHLSTLPNAEYNAWLSQNLKRHDARNRKNERMPALHVIDIETRNTLERGYFQNGLLDDPYEVLPAHRKFDPGGNEIYRGHYKKGQRLNPARGAFAEIWRDGPTGFVTAAKSHERTLLSCIGGAFFAASFGAFGEPPRIHVRPATLAEIAKLNGRTAEEEIERIDALYSPDTARLVPEYP